MRGPVTPPQAAQKRWRACQSRKDRAWARIAESSAGQIGSDAAHLGEAPPAREQPGQRALVEPRQIEGEARLAAVEAEQERVAIERGAGQLVRREPDDGRAVVDERLEVPQREIAASGVRELRLDPAGITAIVAGAVERAAREDVPRIVA